MSLLPAPSFLLHQFRSRAACVRRNVKRQKALLARRWSGKTLIRCRKIEQQHEVSEGLRGGEAVMRDISS